MSKAQRNSFITIAEQVQLLNNNAVSLLTSLNNIVTSQDSAVNVVQLDNEGNEITYALPTVGKLQSDIEIVNNNIKRLSGLNSNTVHVIDGNSTKKIFLSDLNREPNKIDRLNTVSTFNAKSNWFFESMMNPLLSVTFDLTDKIGSDVDGVISRRYIVDFEKDGNGNYTERGEISRQDFLDKFVNRNDISFNEFLKWLTNTENLGVVNNSTPVYDEQIFQFDYQEVNEHGNFTVLKEETDRINKKHWYHIYPNTYVTLNGETKVIQRGDEVVLNRQDSVTRWKIIETSTSSSEFRIRVERIEGYDPIPTQVSGGLKIYGGKNIKNSVSVSIGFDEYLVIFVKPLNSRNKIKGTIWSKGTGVYTNDLVLDTNSNVSMSQYYLDTVYDYGTLLKDMIEKTIPSKFGLKPNSPVLEVDNFKVVQINKHLTDTPDSQRLKDLYSQNISTKSKLEQVNNAIIQKNKELSVRTFTSIGERNKVQNELIKLVQEQESLSKLLISITNEMKSINDNIVKAEPKFRIRGFWDIPLPVQEAGYRPQEVVQFVTEYRYSSKTGVENQTEGYSLTDGSTAYYSNWVPLKSDLRKRTYDEISETWTWEIVDVSDADTPNINQLDIPITKGEKVEIRIKSVSEVGYPDIESDWSNILVIEFPDDLNNILGENEFILQEANRDSVIIDFEQRLNSKGVNQHVSESYTVNESYFAHKDRSIETIFKDEQGNPFNLQEYLQFLTNKINTLEQIIYSAKGVMKISIFNGTDEIQINNNSEVNIDVVLQNYANTTDNIEFENKLYIIKDFSLKIENLSVSSSLSFLVRDIYISGTTIRMGVDSGLTCLVDKDNDLIIQENGQYIYFCDNAGGSMLYDGSLEFASGYTTYGSTQQLSTYIINNNILPGLSSGYVNKGRDGNPNGYAYSALGEGITIYNINDWNYNAQFATLICPQVNTIDDLILKSAEIKSITNNEFITIPINIYAKFQTNGSVPVIDITQLSYKEHIKKLRVRLHPSSVDGPFDFIITFNIKNKNK